MPSPEAASCACSAAISAALIEAYSRRAIDEYAHSVAAARRLAFAAKSREARAALGAVVDRLREFASAHRALRRPRRQAAIDLAGYFERLCRALAASLLSERRILLSLSVEPALIDSERCWKLGLIASELIADAARCDRRDGGGEIRVRIEPIGSTLACRVADNGGADRRLTASRGWTLARRLVDELGGAMSWRVGAGGARVDVSIPIDATILL